jgi:hypothetical protein
LHKKNCQITNILKYHNKYHKKICECRFDEFNIHLKNCEFIKLINTENDQDKFTFKYYKDKYIKICCCAYKNTLKDLNENIINNNDEIEDIYEKKFEEIPHSEHLKFILEQRQEQGQDNDEEKKIFEDNEKIEELKNKNINYYCIPKFDDNKAFSIIGRRDEMKKICDIINLNINQFIIIYGPKEIGKEDFVECLCVHLYERKIIKMYSNIIEIENLNKISKIRNEISYLKSNVDFKENKYIIAIKISYLLDEQKSIELLNKIMNEIKMENKNIYFIIIIAQNEKPDINNNCEIFSLKKLNINSAKDLIQKLCNSYIIQKNTELKQLFEIANYEHNIINDIAQNIYHGVNYEKLEHIIKEKINSEIYIQSIIEQYMKKENISKLYYLLAIMPCGLPLSLIKL